MSVKCRTNIKLDVFSPFPRFKDLEGVGCSDEQVMNS